MVHQQCTLNWHILPGGVFVGWYESGGTYEPSGSTGEAAPYDAMGTLSSRVSIRYCLHHPLIKETKNSLNKQLKELNLVIWFVHQNWIFHV